MSYHRNDDRTLEDLMMGDSPEATTHHADSAAIHYHARIAYIHEHHYVPHTTNKGKTEWLFNPSDLSMLTMDPNAILSKAFRAELYDPPTPQR
jgi:hypothetical protein